MRVSLSNRATSEGYRIDRGWHSPSTPRPGTPQLSPQSILRIVMPVYEDIDRGYQTTLKVSRKHSTCPFVFIACGSFGFRSNWRNEHSGVRYHYYTNRDYFSRSLEVAWSRQASVHRSRFIIFLHQYFCSKINEICDNDDKMLSYVYLTMSVHVVNNT